jgi:tripartite-type tricarboxylate transporter receptor subunit TctC
LRAALFSLVVLASLAASIASAAAADYPNRPVRWLIGFSAGGPVDIVARIMSQWPKFMCGLVHKGGARWDSVL